MKELTIGGDAAYSAFYPTGKFNPARADMVCGAKVYREENCPTMAERVAKIIERAREDGYEVPPIPDDKE